MWSLFKISRGREGHIVIGVVSVYPAFGLHSPLSWRFSLAGMIQTSSNKGPDGSRNGVSFCHPESFGCQAPKTAKENMAAPAGPWVNRPPSSGGCQQLLFQSQENLSAAWCGYRPVDYTLHSLSLPHTHACNVSANRYIVPILSWYSTSNSQSLSYASLMFF